MNAFVIMGVSGCGKSSVGARVAQKLAWTWIDGDDFHSENNKAKMSQGIPLTDEDRIEWLDTLVAQLHQRLQQGQRTILLCSALRQRYRNQFRSQFPNLSFVFLDISEAESLRRVSVRAATHMFPPTLVASQFATLESPKKEAGVLTLNAERPLEEICDAIVNWAQTSEMPCSKFPTYIGEK
jgi:gluconokinase